MNWGSADNFFHMGGYGLYVWGSYAVTAALMLLEPVLVAARRRRAFREATANANNEDISS
jgi:heme exporter protein D